MPQHRKTTIRAFVPVLVFPFVNEEGKLTFEVASRYRDGFFDNVRRIDNAG